LNNSPTIGTHLNLDTRETLPVWMSNVGYDTGLFGKDRTQPNVEAQYPSEDFLAPPPGWSSYLAGVASGPTGFSTAFSDNGTLVQTGPNDYVTDVLSDRLLGFVNRTNSNSPFFAYFAPYAPHAPGVPAPRHAHAYDGLIPPRLPDYLVIPPNVPVPSAEVLALSDRYFREGSESLLAVDEAITALFQSLTARHELDNTVVLFTSDNGHGYGEHGNLAKNIFWEESIRVPLMMWDGRNQVGQTTDSLATTVGLTATLVDLAGAHPGSNTDGASLAPVLASPNQTVRQDMLLEHHYTDGDLSA